jgi:predicted O-linked N-acetylglucosamine transferase (SPINDLY family)
MPLFLRRPAPVQLSYLGYPASTGISAIEYRLTDAFLDPPESDAHYIEKLLRLLDVFATYLPPQDTPEVRPAPFLSRDYITFGCFANPIKISDAAIDAFIQILRDVPNSLLKIVAPGLEHNPFLHRLRGAFASSGLALDRLLAVPHVSRTEFFPLHSDVDIALDTFP